MTYDLVIRNGSLIDGTGAAPFPGDIAVVGDTIVAMGRVEGLGKREIDAEGHAVTPGFIDLHTHLDAQVGWDPLLAPLSYHGVTTALMGNCGVTFAPCKPTDHALLAEMMESVEDIPRASILGGLPWDWESYGEYLDSIDRLNPAINLAGLVGHSAVRFYVMGQRAIDNQPTPDEIDQIADTIGRSIADGAFGVSVNRLHGHAMPDGRDIPGTDAEEDELLAIARSVKSNGGLFQTIPNYATNMAREMDLLHTIGRACHRLLWSAPVAASRGSLEFFESRVQRMLADGIDVTGLSSPRSGGFISGISVEIFLDLLPAGQAWVELKAMTFPQRLAAILDETFRARLIADAAEQRGYDERSARTYPLGSGRVPNWWAPDSDSLLSRSRETGKPSAELWLDAMVESQGKALFIIRTHNRHLASLREFIDSEWALPGLGDAGAHVTISMDSAFSSLMLSHWVRDTGVFSLEAAIRRLTSMQARVLGLNDRGVLAVGKRADINVIDADRVTELQPEMLHEFPGSAPHLSQRAAGYRATVCNGTIILIDDEHTGDRGGRVLRNPLH
jgi:N-acyl-D-amino-acid deacylase